MHSRVAFGRPQEDVVPSGQAGGVQVVDIPFQFGIEPEQVVGIDTRMALRFAASLLYVNRYAPVSLSAPDGSSPNIQPRRKTGRRASPVRAGFSRRSGSCAASSPKTRFFLK